MYREGELVEVRENISNPDMDKDGLPWISVWKPAVVIQHHGKTKMRTGLTRFETIDVVSVFIEGSIKKVPARNIRYPTE